jgi:ABC-2 type transport system permease protein
VRHVALAVQDLDGSRASRDLLSAFVNSTYFDVAVVADAGDDLERITRKRSAKAVLVIPVGYGEDLAAGRTGAVQLLLDGTDATTAQTILGYAGAIAAEANSRLLHGVLARTGADPPQMTAYQPRVFYNPELRSTQFLVPGLIGFLLMLTAVLSTAMSVVREKERGTMEQIRVSPVRTAELILGKATPYLVISLLATAIIIVAARVLFGVVVRGSYLDLFVATVLYLLGALGFGLLISTIADTQALAFQIGLLTSLLPAMLLSGFIFPIRTMPVLLRAITNLVPARHFLVVLRGIILKGASLEPYVEQLIALAVFAVLTLALASVRMARREA